MTKRKQIIVLISLILFCFINFGNVYGQLGVDTSTIINCTNNDSELALQLSNEGVPNEFKISTICPTGGNHNLIIDSVDIYIAVTTTDPDVLISVYLDDSLTNTLKSLNFYFNQAIEIETALIDTGILMSDTTTFSVSPSVNIVKIIFEVYEGTNVFTQDTIGLEF